MTLSTGNAVTAGSVDHVVRFERRASPATARAGTPPDACIAPWKDDVSAAADLDGTSLPDPLVDRALRLFSFLGQAQQLRSPSVSDLDSYRRDGAVHWLHDVPEHPAVQL